MKKELPKGIFLIDRVKPRKDNRTGRVYNTRIHAFKAQISSDKTVYSKSISIRKYGEEKALKMAKAFIKKHSTGLQYNRNESGRTMPVLCEFNSKESKKYVVRWTHEGIPKTKTFTISERTNHTYEDAQAYAIKVSKEFGYKGDYKNICKS